MNAIEKAYRLLGEWKKENYIFGMGVLDRVGGLAAEYGKRVLVISTKSGLTSLGTAVVDSLRNSGCVLTRDQIVLGAKPNAPREDVYRLETYILHDHPDCVVAIGGGSTLDACKAAVALAALGDCETPEIDPYFGTGLVSAALKKHERRMAPLIAVETVASSGSHLTKYSNITDPVAGQKKLIVDDAMVPPASLFDYETTLTTPVSVTVDGALDAMSHTFEVFCGAGEDTFDLKRELAETAFELTLAYTKRIIENPMDRQAREALGLASDLGGYAIMVGGTSGAHLTSFSLVDLAAHGTACGIMNPYYAVFYAPAIQKQLDVIGRVFRKYGFIWEDVAGLDGRAKAAAVAEGWRAFNRSIHAPTTLGELKGFSEKHVERILSAAKDPQLSMKLRNMPVPMNQEDVDGYMEPIIRAAADGDISRIVNKA